MAVRAADDVAAIREAMDRIKKESTPMCPHNAGKTLYDCLRSPTKCGPNCEHANDWIGPQ